MSAQTKIFLPHEIWKHILTSTDFTLDDYITTIPILSNSCKQLASQFVLTTYNTHNDSEETFTGLLGLFRFEDGAQEDCWMTLRRARKYHRAVADLVEIVDDTIWEDTKIQQERTVEVKVWIQDLVGSTVMKMDGIDRRFLEAMVEDNKERYSAATEKVVQELNEQAERGNVAARDLLAICLLYGIGTEQNQMLAERQMEICRHDYARFTSRNPLSLACWCRNRLLMIVHGRMYWEGHSIEVADMFVQFGMRARARATVEELLLNRDEKIETKLRVVQIFGRLESGVYRKILDDAETLARARPNSTYLLLSLLNILVTVKEHDRALALLNATFLLNFTLRKMPPTIHLANVLKRLGDQSNAISVAKQVISRCKYPDEKIRAARVLVELGRIQIGRDVAEEALSNIQADVSLALPLIALLIEVGEDHKARDVLLTIATACLSDAVGDAELIFRQMHSLGMNGQMAGICFEDLPQTTNLARGAYATGDVISATLILEKVLKASPFSNSVKAQVAREFGKMRLNSRAVSILNMENGLLIDPNDIIAFAHAWAELGFIDKVIELLNEVVEPESGMGVALIKKVANVLATLVNNSVIKFIDMNEI